MARSDVEEILAAARKLSGRERKRLIKVLQLKSNKEKRSVNPRKTLHQVSNAFSRDQLPPNRDPEMKWLLDHPEFWNQHRGEYVALWGYDMIAVGKTSKEVVAQARSRGIKFPFIQYLPKDESEWLLGLSNQPLDLL